MRRYAVTHLFLMAAVVLLLVAPACKKRPPAVAGSPTPAVDRPGTAPVSAPAPTIQLSASRTSIPLGEQTTLTWSSAHASSILIDNGIGNVSESGSLVVSPLESVTYTATARGGTGTPEARASTRITVLAPTVDNPVVDQTDIRSLRDAIERGLVRPVFFDYDRAELSPDARRTLEQNANYFRRFPNAIVIVEGHCDERGTEEYNLALGERRAQAAKEYLVQLGVNSSQLETISYGEERPFVLGHDESAWSQNRRAHFTVREF